MQTSSPWIAIGDFSTVLNLDERVGSVFKMHEIQPFGDCVLGCGLIDIKSSRRFYTWSNKQEEEHKVFSRIDRAMGNGQWIDRFKGAKIAYFSDGDFDHSPGVLCVYDGRN